MIKKNIIFRILILFLVHSSVALPFSGQITKTGTFVDTDLSLFSLRGDGNLLFSAGNASPDTYHVVTIDPNKTGTFSDFWATAPTSNNSSYSHISHDGRLGMAVSLIADNSVTVDLFDITGDGKSIIRFTPYKASLDANYVDELIVDPLHRFAVLNLADLANNESLSGLLFTFCPSAGAVILGTQMSNRNGRYLDVGISPDGSKLALALQGKNSVEFKVYAIDPGTAVLTERATFSRSASSNDFAAAAFSVDGAYVYLIISSLGTMFSFNAAHTGTLAPISAIENIKLAKNGHIKVAASTIISLGFSSDMRVGVNIVQAKTDGTLEYRGCFIPDSSRPSIIYANDAQPDALGLASDGKIGMLMYKLAENLSSSRCRLYTFNTAISGDNTTALDTVTYTPGGQFTPMAIRQSDSGGRLVAYPCAYVFGTAHILSLEMINGAAPTPISTPTPTPSPTPTPTRTPTPSILMLR